MNKFTLHHGDCLLVLKGMPDNSVDSIVTDPPYGLSFMGKKWDYDVPSVEIWSECLRVLKPGGHLLAFAGTRTQHRMAVRIEDAGFEIRDMIMWCYGSGFPKSMDVSKAIDKAAGAEREVLSTETRYNEASGIVSAGRNERTLVERKITAPATEAARQWQGWGTALKPALEPITVARKPLSGTVAANVLQHGTGAMNIDGCRVAGGARPLRVNDGAKDENGFGNKGSGVAAGETYAGRWPANLIHSGEDDAIAGLGQAARYFYCAKASKADRNSGGVDSTHPTVKPTDLMAYLVRLVTPPGGLVLDPFMGSGSTGKAAMREGMRFVGCELDPEYLAIARARIEHELDIAEAYAAIPANDNAQPDLFLSA